jgi:hypothetical protein
MSFLKEEKTTMGNNSSSLPPPDESIQLEPRINFLETNRALLSTTRVDLSNQTGNLKISADALSPKITAINARIPNVSNTLSSNSFKIEQLITNSLVPISSYIWSNVSLNTSIVLNMMDYDTRLQSVQSAIEVVNVSDLSDRIFTASTGMSDSGVRRTNLQTIYDTTNARWAPLQTLTANIGLSIDSMILLRDNGTTNLNTQDSTVSNVSYVARGYRDDMLTYNTFVTSTLSYLSSSFLTAYNSRTTKTNSDLTALTTTTQNISTRMSTLVANVSLSVAAELTQLGMRGAFPKIINLWYTGLGTPPRISVTADLHNAIIYTNVSRCLYFGLDVDVPDTRYASRDTNWNVDWVDLKQITSLSAVTSKYYPDGLRFTVVYTGTMKGNVQLCFFRYIQEVLIPTITDVTNRDFYSRSIDWFMNPSSPSTTEYGVVSSSGSGATVVFTVATLNNGLGRRCMVMNA